MSQNDYIILRDEDGKAYIAHAGLLDNARNAIRGAANSISTTAQQVANKAKGVGRGVRQNHKYILKVLENGKTRYFYKQEEVKAYYEAKKRGVKNAAEYAQNAVKDKASDVADVAKNVVNKATGATANKTAETAKKNADDASRWAKMTERVHKENVANFKQNPTEANLARAKQSGQAITRANQNEKNARKEADKAQDMADQHPVNKAKSAFNQAKVSASNSVMNAKTNYNRMKSEFRDKAEQAATKASDMINKAKKTVKDASQQLSDNLDIKQLQKNLERDMKNHGYSLEDAYNQHKDWLKTMQSGQLPEEHKEYYKKMSELEDKAYQELKAKNSANSSAQDMIDRARTAVKDKSEDLSAKAKSTAQSARDSVKGMIDNARSSTAKAVNEAWDRIPKNSDGTVNPFDPNFQSTYNNWKNRKDKYDNSLTGRAKVAAEKATDAVQDMIDQARKAVKGNSASNFTREQEQTNTGSRQTKRTPERTWENSEKKANIRTWDDVDQEINERGHTKNINPGTSSSGSTQNQKSTYGEYSDNDKDFAEKNYSKKNHVEDTDFYTFKRDDGKWVILEEDMKWVLPEGVTGNDPGVRNALKQFADHASSAKAIGNANYNNDQWVDAVTDAIDKAAERQSKKK